MRGPPRKHAGTQLLQNKCMVAQWVARLTCDRWMPVRREFEPHQWLPLFHWANDFYLHYLVLDGSRNGFERYIRELKVLASQLN